MTVRALRNNNPGDLEWGAFARLYGATASDGRFAIFPDIRTGLRALCELLIVYATKPDGKGGLIDTVEETIYKWCPPSGPGGENKAATEAYIAGVCAVLGCDRHDEFDFNDPHFLFWMATAIGEQECGHDAFLAAANDDDINAAVALALAS